jgi:sodium/hydrogen antiporter
MKTYELPSQKSEGDIVSQSLKYMGMGGLVKGGEKANAPASPTGEGEVNAAPRPGMASWASGMIRRGTVDASKVRKKSMAEEQEEDDRHIRFTIGGIGRRMTKENFIHEMQKLDKSTRREVVDQSSASGRVKTLAKQDPPTAEKPKQAKEEGGAAAATKAPPPTKTGWQGGSVNYGQGSSTSGEASGSSSRSESPGGGKAVALDLPSRGDHESAAERRRRLAALKTVDGTEDDAGETAAERRRREAALGMSAAAGGEEDSEDDDTPRVPPPKRGIRFAEPQKNRE